MFASYNYEKMQNYSDFSMGFDEIFRQYRVTVDIGKRDISSVSVNRLLNKYFKIHILSMYFDINNK